MLTDEDRAEFNAWVKSTTGVLFSHGAESSNFYFSIWQAGKRAGKAENEAALAEAKKVIEAADAMFAAGGMSDEDCAYEKARVAFDAARAKERTC